MTQERTQNDEAPLSLSTAAARNLATTAKTPPQMQSITPRWLLRMLPWVETAAGTYRVNRRLTYTVGDGQVTFNTDGGHIRVIPQELGELPLLRGFDDAEVLRTLADRFVQREIQPSEVIAEAGQPVDQVLLLAHGKVNKLGAGKYGDQVVLSVLAEGAYFGEQILTGEPDSWAFTVKAVTPCTVLSLPREQFERVRNESRSLRSHLDQARTAPKPARNRYGEAEIDIAAGHHGEPSLPGTFVAYELAPREYELAVAQTVLRVHTRVADLYNKPMNQSEQQLRLTIEELRERQEHDLVNNPEFGLLHNVDPRQHLYTRTGPPTPDDLDDLLARRRKSRFFLAHPRTIAAFGRECSRLGIYPATVDVQGHEVIAWRGVPLLPCDKIPITEHGTSSILAMRVGEREQGVVGLRQTGIPDEYEPGLNVRFMGINQKAVISYLISTYYSVAVLVPDALGVLDHVEIGK